MRESAILFLGIVIGLLITMTAYLSTGDCSRNNPLLVEDVYIDYISRTTNTSDSMGLAISSRDTLQLRKVLPTDTLLEGRVYTYDKGNKSIIHRLVKCLDVKCSQAVFKGDNNYVGEIVRREDVTNLLTGIVYNGYGRGLFP